MQPYQAYKAAWKTVSHMTWYCTVIRDLTQGMRFPTMWYVRPAKPPISLRICAVWSEPLLVAWVFYDCWATDWKPFGVSKLRRRLQRLVRVYRCQNVTLLEISCTGSLIFISVILFEETIELLLRKKAVVVFYLKPTISNLNLFAKMLNSLCYLVFTIFNLHMTWEL